MHMAHTPNGEDANTWIRDLAAAGAIRVAGEEGLRRVRNVLALLRELRDRGQLPAACEPDLRALEDLWTTLKREGRARGEPKITDKKIMSELVRMTTGQSDAEIVADFERIAEVEVQPEWVAAALRATERAKKGRRKPAKKELLDLVRRAMEALGVEKEAPFGITASIVARFQALNVAMQNREVAEAVTQVLTRGVHGMYQALAETPLRVSRPDPSSIDGMSLVFDPKELRAVMMKIASSASSEPGF